MPPRRGPHRPSPNALADAFAAKLAPPPLLCWARIGETLGWLLLCPKRPAAGFIHGDLKDRKASPRLELAERLEEVRFRLPILQEMDLWHAEAGTWLRVDAWLARGARR